jgi:hypothetical protein
MMANWFEVVAWTVALLLLHEGLTQRAQGHGSGFARAMPFIGAIIILVGAGLWYWNAQGLQQLANVLQTPPVATNAAVQKEEAKKLPLPQRKELSIRMAKAVFVSGGELVEVATDEGLWIPYSPSADDVKARDRQLQANFEVNTRRQELIAGAQIAEEHSKRWLTSLLVAICTGLVAGRLRRRVPKG